MAKTLLIGGAPGVRSHVLAALDVLRPLGSITLVPRESARVEVVAGALEFDLVIVDVSVAEAGLADLLVELHSAASVRPIVALIADRREDALGALQGGASGVLSCEAGSAEVFAALASVLDGGVYVPARLMRAVPSAPGGGVAPFEIPIARTHSIADLASLGLTPRQTEVLAMLLQGQSNKAIARALHLSVETIKDHVAAVLRSLAVHSRTQAVLAVERMLRANAFPRAVAPSLQSAWQGVVAGRRAASVGASAPA